MAVCLFGEVPDWKVVCWLKAWREFPNANPVVAIYPKGYKPTCYWPHPLLEVSTAELSKGDTHKNRGQADVVKAQAFHVLKRPCIVVDVDTLINGALGMTRKPMAMVTDFEGGKRKWNPPLHEFNAGVIYQNIDLWPAFRREWEEGLTRNPGGLCYGQYIFARLMEKFGGASLPERFNWQHWTRWDRERNFNIRTDIPVRTLVVHYHGDMGHKMLQRYYEEKFGKEYLETPKYLFD
jgi:hypothetical protein